MRRTRSRTMSFSGTMEDVSLILWGQRHPNPTLLKMILAIDC